MVLEMETTIDSCNAVLLVQAGELAHTSLRQHRRGEDNLTCDALISIRLFFFCLTSQ